MGNYFCKLNICDKDKDEDIYKFKIPKKKYRLKFKNLYKTSPGPPIFNLL